MANRKRRDRKRGSRQVDRSERVKPTPETLAKLKPWPMQSLLHAGPEHDGIDADEFEAAIEIVETFKGFTARLQAHGIALAEPRAMEYAHDLVGEMSDRLAMMVNVWFEWCWQIGPVATQLVEQIEDEQPIRSVTLLRMALRRWLKVKHDLFRPIDSTPERLTACGQRSVSAGDRGAIPISYPSTTFSPRPNAAGAAPQAALRSASTKR